MYSVIFGEFALSSTLTRRSCLAGFDVTYNSNVYAADGMIVDIGNSVRELAFKNTTQQVTLSFTQGTNNDVRDAFLSGSYRRRIATLYKGDWEPSTQTLSNVVILKSGIMDATNSVDDDGTMSIIISSQIIRTQRSPDNVALATLHQDRLRRGVYGDANKTVVDKIFDNANRNFNEVKLGEFRFVEAVTRERDILFGLAGSYEEVVTNALPERAGIVPIVSQDNYQVPRVFGTAIVTPKVINAWNVTDANVQTRYGGVTGNTTINRTQDSADHYQGWRRRNFIGNTVGASNLAAQWIGTRGTRRFKRIN